MYYFMASSDLGLNGTSRHVPLNDLSAATIMYWFMASVVTLASGSRHVPLVDLSAATSMYYFMASGDLGLN